MLTCNIIKVVFDRLFELFNNYVQSMSLYESLTVVCVNRNSKTSAKLQVVLSITQT